ncbi:uncharacterized protein MKZ38_001625 [Zalerion maritima]|uniref:Carboxylesterase type B domain-containing protein n=1 Tax=Zalerion maritima TaxID=339359 RepID=A0AAD5RXS1_9PEZI|nr:uncharacterized protein MKZ38_001625 [Zalerion maritima]
MSVSQHQPATFQHPTIGTIRCQRADGVLRFLGVRYGTLRHWFDNAQLCNYDGSGITADHHGPQAISDPKALDLEYAAIQRSLPNPEFPGLSGTQCLSLNIHVPEGSDASSLLPVLVFIHGGGFAAGSNWWPQYDMQRIVQLSAKQGKPVIGININYRLGAPGFAISEELLEAGYKANRGLHDQRLALQWVKQHIAGFGGDAARVTVSGESVGGLSTTRLLYTEETLASRIVVLGGAPPSMSPLPPAVADSTYQTMVERLELQKLPRDERLKALQDVSISAIQTKLGPDLSFFPVLDNSLVPLSESFSSMASEDYILKRSPCEAAMIVYSPLEMSIFAFMGVFAQRQGIAAAFAKSLRASLASHPDPDAAAARLLQCHGITPELDDKSALLRVLQFGSGIASQAAARALASSFPGDAFLLQFSEPNPWDGPFTGHSTHILDAAFLFQNYNDHLSATQRAAAVQFAADVIAFAHGQEPWKPVRTANETAILEGGKRRQVEGPQAMTEPYRLLVEIGESVGLDSLLGAWLAFVFAM